MPAKKAKDKKKSNKFNFRKPLIHYLYCLSIIAMLTATGININNFINKQKVLGASVDVSSLQEEKNYWENLIKKNPTFVDGYLQLAKIYSLMGKKDEAILQIKSALSFDPNSMKIIQVQRLLNL